MLVLFTGGRGSGKSTVARALYDELDAGCVDYVSQSSWRLFANNIFKKIVFIFYFLTFFRLKICLVFFSRFFRDFKNGRSRGGVARIYMPCIFSYHITRLEKNKVKFVFYDSDFLTWSSDKAIDGCFDPAEVHKFYKDILLPKVHDLLVVVLDTPVNCAVVRWRIRDNKLLTSAEQRMWIEQRGAWKNARNKVLEVVSTIPNVKVLCLDGLDSPEENANKIIDLLG